MRTVREGDMSEPERVQLVDPRSIVNTLLLKGSPRFRDVSFAFPLNLATRRTEITAEVWCWTTLLDA